MARSEDPGLCLLGASALLEHVKALRSQSAAARSMDVEGIHQMRVASRRLRASLPVFSSCFKPSQYDRWRGGIKGITTALGEARDADVQVEYLRDLMARAPEGARPGIAAVLDHKVRQRGEVQEQVLGWLDNLKEEGILEEMEARLAKLVQRLEASHADRRCRVAYAVGLASVTNRVHGVLKLEECVDDSQAAAKHHALRIAAKRLRYTLEVFKPLFDDQLKAEIGELKQAQDVLGEMHDCDVWLSGMDALNTELTELPEADAEQLALGLDAIRHDRARERERLYGELTARWARFRRERFFERLGERFQAGMSYRDLAVPVISPEAPVKLAIISDVHGNLDALKAVLEDAKQRGAGAFLSLGDMVGTGAYPEEVIHILRDDHVLGVVGNFDIKVLEFARAARRPRVRSVKGAIVAAAARDLSEESMDFIASLPPELRLEVLGKKLLLVHASPADPDEHLGPETPEHRLAELGRIADADIVLVGHSHKPFVREVDGVLFANPGSVGRPGDHDPRASYAILDTKDFSVTVHRVEYDVEAAVKALLEKGLPDKLAEVLRQGLSSSEIQGQHNAPPKSTAAQMEQLEIIARRMNPDHRHAEHVLKLSAALFRQLKALHGLGGKDRVVLEAAALLHDIGIVEGIKGHHKASYRLILEQKLPLTADEKMMVACMARFHRKRAPKGDEPELASLSVEQRERYMKLASLLRVADGLDRSHGAVVRDVECAIGEDTVAFRLSSKGDHSAEAEAALAKADLFERTFHRKAVFE